MQLGHPLLRSMPARRRFARHALPHAVVLACLSLAIAAPVAHAQAPAASAQAKRYDIAAGSLDQVLNRFATQAGILLAIDGSLTAGRTSGGLSGSFGVRDGLAAILANSGLEAVSQPAGGYALRRAGASAESTLPAITVTGRMVRDGTTEGSGSYAGSTMSTAALLPLTARETPQSVTVITRDRIEDQAMVKASDALKYTPGITPHTWSGPNREAYFARGFAIENFTYDGLPAAYTTAGGHGLLNDLVIYDRVEVVRGATGLSQGTGSPSATINFVRKRPTRTFQTNIEATLGQWNHYGATVDVSGPLNSGGSVRGRAVVSASQADSFQDVVGEDRSVIYAIGEADLGERTTLTAAISHQRNNDISTWAGLPTAMDGSDLHLPRSTFVGNDWNHWDTTNTSVFASLEHRFGNGWKLVGALNHIDGDQARCVTGILRNGNGLYDLNANCGNDALKRSSVDVRAQGPFELFGRKHDLVAGAAVREGTESGAVAGYGTVLVATDVDIRNWNHQSTPPKLPDAIDYYFSSKTRERGFYSAARFNLSDALKLIVGARVDWYRMNFRGDYFDSWDTFEWQGWSEAFAYDRHVTKYAGATFDLNKQWTLYASYTDIFQPQGAMDKNGKFIDPIIGKNYEAGIKGALADGRLEIDAAVFRIDQDNIAVSDPVSCPPPGPGCSRPGGLVRSQGFDIEVRGRLTPSWEIGAGYTYANPKTLRNADDPAAEGQPIDTHLPRRLFKANTTYRLPGDQWRVGAGLRWQSDIEHYNNWMDYDYRTAQKAYAVADAMVSYEHTKNLTLQLNVSNLFDKTYWRVINTQPVEWGGNALYGEPRRVMLTARYKF